MRILYIIESLGSGGKERRMISLIKELLKKERFEIELLLLSEDIHYKEIHELGLTIHSLPRNIKKDFSLLSKFNKLLKAFKPDIVHCWDTIASIHFAPVCKIKGIPFVNAMISTAPPILSRRSLRYIYNAVSYPFSDIILTNSKAGLASFRVPKNKGRFIHNGFDFERVHVKSSKESIRKKFGIDTEKVVGMVASFTQGKDYETFVKAGENILEHRNDVTFLAIGGGPKFEEIKNSVHKKNKAHFKFSGRQEDVESIVNIFDIGVLATYTEGISNAIMEYMIFEKPVVATDGGGTNEIVIDKKTGFLVRQRDVAQLTEKIKYLLENTEEASAMGKMGKERIEKYFSIDRMVAETLKLYKSCLK